MARFKHAVCRSCGTDFSYEARGGRGRLYCSERCQLDFQYARAAERREAAKPAKPRCINCGLEMLARRADRRYCGGADCQEARQASLRAEREASLPPKPRCGHCGGEMSSRRKDARYCNLPECRAVSKAELIKRNRPCSVDGCERGVLARGYCPSHYKSEYHIPRFGVTPKKVKTRICLCGAEVRSLAGKQKYCSDVCRYAWRDVERSESKAVVVWAPPLHIPVVRSPRVVVLPPKQSRRFGCVCAICGVSFVADGMHATCSPECAKVNKREKVKRNTRKYLRRHGKFAIEPSVRWSIYERDGWVCQLCGGEVSRVYDRHDPMSPTLDHVVPRSLQLVQDHSPENLRLAHALCNSKRSNNVDWAPDVVLSA